MPSFLEELRVDPDIPRRTKIVATFGNQTTGKERELIGAGVDVVRINASHGTLDQYAKIIDAAWKYNDCVAVLLDLKGPEIRTADMEGERQIVAGEEVVFSVHPLTETDRCVIQVNYPGMVSDLQRALDEGRAGVGINMDNEADFEIIRVDEAQGTVTSRAIDGVTLKSRRHVNLVNVDISLPTFPDYDWPVIDFGIESGVTFIAPSYPRRPEDIQMLRQYLAKRGSKAGIIPKYENRESLMNLDGMIEASDGGMIARGDLFIEIGRESLGIAQDHILRKHVELAKPVIFATGVVESLERRRHASRAEVAGIFNAIEGKAHALMTSGETTNSLDPVHTIHKLSRYIIAAEQYILRNPQREPPPMKRNGSKKNVIGAAVEWSRWHDRSVPNPIDAIIARDSDGRLAADLSLAHPDVPIVAVVPDPQAGRYLNLYRGVSIHPEPIPGMPTDVAIQNAVEAAAEWGIVQNGRSVLSVAEVTFIERMPVTTLSEIPVVLPNKAEVIQSGNIDRTFT